MKDYYMDWLYDGEEMLKYREDMDEIGKSRGYIPSNRNYLLALGSNTSLILTELFDKQDFYKESKQLNSLGEFFYTVADCEVGTGLSRKQQTTSFKDLELRGFIEYTVIRGMPKIRFVKMASDEIIIKALATLCIEADTKRNKILNRNIESKADMEKKLEAK